MVVVDEEGFLSLPGWIALARSFRAQTLGDVPGTVGNARRALDLLPEDHHIERGGAALLLGLAYWTSGDLDAAGRTYADALASLQLSGNIPFAIGATFALVDIRMAQGRLQEAARTCHQWLDLAAERGQPTLRGTADLRVGLSVLYREHDDLGAATHHLLRSRELGEPAAQEETPYRWRVAMARISEAQGDLDGALDLLDEAEREYVRNVSPDVRPVAALKTRIRVAQGRLAEALGWVREQGLSAEDELSYLREFEHITLARVLIARYKSDRAERSIHEAMGLLERLLKGAEEGERMGSVIEILVLQALAHQAQGNVPRALDPLDRSLTLAEPEGYVRIFVDEGEPMERLLRQVDASPTTSEYVPRLLAAFHRPAEPTPRGPQPLPEPLNDREQAILRLMAARLSNREIADELYLSVNTVKWHARNIYGKLGVAKRTHAAARARELSIL